MNQPITERVMQEAMQHMPGFSVMDILFALNQKRHGPMVDLRQVHHTLDTLARQGQFIKVSAGRYEWSKE